MDIQRLRNLTTGRLHTKMGDIYQDIEYLTGETGVMTHMLPNACRALEPCLRGKVPDAKFWEDVYDTTHIGEVDIPPMDDAERKEFWKRYGALPSPLAGKQVIGVAVQQERTMDLKTAKQVLAGMGLNVLSKDRLHGRFWSGDRGLGWYLLISDGDERTTLDGNFTSTELKAIAAWMDDPSGVVNA